MLEESLSSSNFTTQWARRSQIWEKSSQIARRRGIAGQFGVWVFAARRCRLENFKTVATSIWSRGGRTRWRDSSSTTTRRESRLRERLCSRTATSALLRCSPLPPTLAPCPSRVSTIGCGTLGTSCSSLGWRARIIQQSFCFLSLWQQMLQTSGSHQARSKPIPKQKPSTFNHHFKPVNDTQWPPTRQRVRSHLLENQTVNNGSERLVVEGVELFQCYWSSVSGLSPRSAEFPVDPQVNLYSMLIFSTTHTCVLFSYKHQLISKSGEIDSPLA